VAQPRTPVLRPSLGETPFPRSGAVLPVVAGRVGVRAPPGPDRSWTATPTRGCAELIPPARSPRSSPHPPPGRTGSSSAAGTSTPRPAPAAAPHPRCRPAPPVQQPRGHVRRPARGRGTAVVSIRAVPATTDATFPPQHPRGHGLDGAHRGHELREVLVVQLPQRRHDVCGTHGEDHGPTAAGGRSRCRASAGRAGPRDGTTPCRTAAPNAGETTTGGDALERDRGGDPGGHGVVAAQRPAHVRDAPAQGGTVGLELGQRPPGGSADSAAPVRTVKNGPRAATSAGPRVRPSRGVCPAGWS
jgi:hypothetical protein